ncbi:MAG: hypothetical protein SVC26_02450 [Pseudomonadota bacterium]|nr:hypothetical protein [Pseudomonadota bacterium]
MEQLKITFLANAFGIPHNNINTDAHGSFVCQISESEQLVFSQEDVDAMWGEHLDKIKRRYVPELYA